jgi:hypothetical protein
LLPEQKPGTTSNSYTRPKQDLHGFTGVEGATNAEADKNPGKIYSKKLPWSCLLPITARTHVPHAAMKGKGHLPVNDASSITYKKK